MFSCADETDRRIFMKQLKPLIITAIVLALLAAAVFGMIKLFPQEGTPDTQIPSDFSGETINITDYKTGDVASIEITADDGTSFAVDYSSGKSALRGADGRLSYDESALSRLCEYASRLVASDEIPEGGEDSLFGFDAPRRTITLTLSDGERATLLLGKETPLSDGAYVKLLGEETIYTIWKSSAEVFMKKPIDYRIAELFPPFASSDSILSASLSRPGKATISVVRKELSDGDKNSDKLALTSQYLITSPITADASVDTLYSEFLDKITLIKPAAVVEDHPKDLKKYGLDSPARLSVTANGDIRSTLLIGAKSENGGRYVMLEGVPSVIVTQLDITLLALSHTDITMQLIWFYDSADVSRIDYTLANGETHTFDVEREGGTISGKYDGAPLLDRNATNLYLRTVRFTLKGAFESGTKYGDSEIKIVMTLKDGKTTSLELARMNERQYAAIIDGRTPEFYVGVDEVKELSDAFEIISRGEKIPDMFK